jgi:hypothetical protein
MSAPVGNQARTFEPVDEELAERTREELREVYDHA